MLAFELLTATTTPATTDRLRVGLLDHDPEMGLDVHPACREGVQIAGKMLERLGHHVEIGWPAALNSLWGATAGDFAIVSDAVRPPIIAWVSQRIGRPVQSGELDESTFEAAGRALTRSRFAVLDAQRAIDQAGEQITTWWQDHDVLVTPSTFQPAWPLGSNPGPLEIGTLAAPFSLSGQPSLSVPLHHTASSLPVGVQLVARPGGDEMLLRLAETLQQLQDWAAPPPMPPGDHDRTPH
jgi:amidase